MPDAYGNLTPLEVIAAMRQDARKQFLLSQQSGSAGVRAGASLGAIFGGTIKKTIDTRNARKEEVARLMKTQGISEEQAWDQARQTIGREHAEVRKARRIQEATSDVQDFVGQLPDEIPEDMRRAQGKLYLANKLRAMGMTTEANNLANMASEEMQAARDRQLNIENLKARTRASVASADKTEAEIPFIGVTPFYENVLQRETIVAKLQDPNTQLTPAQRDNLLYAKGVLEAKIAKDSTIVGRTEADRNDPVLMRKLFNDLGDNQVLINNIDETMDLFDDLDGFEKTFWASLARDGIGFMERFFGRKPTETEEQFMQRVTEKEGKSALIAAKVRHALTGAQMSAFEIGYLTPFLPSPDDPVSVAMDKLRIVRDYTQLDSDTRMQMFMQGVTDHYFQTGGGARNNPAVTEVDGEVADPLSAIEKELQRREGQGG